MEALDGRAVRWPVARDEAIALTVEETGTTALPMRACVVGGDVTAGDGGITALRARLIPPDDVADAAARSLTGFERFGRLVYGPALVGFGRWVCARAADLGLRRLYFFQREGVLLAEVVQEIARADGQELRTDVLHVSRAALAPARHTHVSVDYLADRLVARRPRRAGEVVAELGLAPGDLSSWAADRRVTRDDADELYQLITTSEVLLDRADAELQRRRANILRYLSSAVDVDAEQIGVVDLGWAASIQRSLSSALGQLGFEGLLRGFYLATGLGAERTIAANNRIEGFIAHLGAPDEAGAILRNPEILEQSCLERTGSVVTFDADGRPVRAVDDIGPSQWDAIAGVQDGVRAFVHEWAAHEPTGSEIPATSIEVWRLATRQALARFCARPTRQEIELFRTWRHDDNKGTRSVEMMVPAIFEERSPAAAMLAGALEMDELLWASAVTALNGGPIDAVPVRASASIADAGRAASGPAINVVGRATETSVAVYVGGEANRLGAVRIAVRCGRAIVRLRHITVEIEAADDRVVERWGTFDRVELGRRSTAGAGELALVKGRTLRLTVPLHAIGQRLAPDQRLRVLVDLHRQPLTPDRHPLTRAVISRGKRVARSSFEWLLPHAVRLARVTGTEQRARRLVADLRKAGVPIPGRRR